MAVDTNTETTEQPLEDEAVQEVIARDEAGISDLVTVYEGIEQRYFAAVAAVSPAEAGATYSTHT